MGFLGFILWIVFCFVVASFGKDKNIGWGGAFVVSLIFSPLIGIIVVALSSKKVVNLQWKTYAETAKKAEYKGETSEAISLYKDAMYHLENDYTNLSNADEQIRNNRLNELRAKIEELNSSLATNP
jgi:hypothetical protein